MVLSYVSHAESRRDHVVDVNTLRDCRVRILDDTSHSFAAGGILLNEHGHSIAQDIPIQFRTTSRTTSTSKGIINKANLS